MGVKSGYSGGWNTVCTCWKRSSMRDKDAAGFES